MPVEKLPEETVAGYLGRLGFAGLPAPTVASLARLHQRHVERVTYENVDIQLRRASSVLPIWSARRVAAGGGGYCFHLNGAFASLLATLGFDVSVHYGQVKQDAGLAHGVIDINHAVLTVRCQGQQLFVDVGLGDALHSPLPLRAGVYHQQPLTIELVEYPTGWRFVHDSRGAFVVMDWRNESATMTDFVPVHQRLSTAPTSSFVRSFVAARRGADRVSRLVNRTLFTVDSHGVDRLELTTLDQWRRVLAEVFGVAATDTNLDDVADLWRLLS